MIAYAKANPGKLTYASFGTGTTSHIAGEMLKAEAGIDIVHVPTRARPRPARTAVRRCRCTSTPS